MLLGRPVHASAELEQNCAFDGAYVALEEQRPEWSAVRTFFTHAGGLRWSQVQNLERRGCRSEHDRRGRLNDCQEHWGSISRSVRTVQGRIDALRVRRALSLRDISMVADIKLSILRE